MMAITTERTPLAVGDRAWCFLAASAGEVREHLVGAAQVRVVEIDGDVHRVELLHVSTTSSNAHGPFYRPGLGGHQARTCGIPRRGRPLLA